MLYLTFGFQLTVALSGKGLISVFQGFSAAICEAFVAAVGLGAGLSLCGVWTLS